MKRLTIATFALLLAAWTPLAYASDTFLGIPRFKGVAPLKDRAYQESCGECHFAYFPGLLPARSWKRLMKPTNLENHFGENAELDEADRRYIEDWLVRNAADKQGFPRYKRSVKIARSVPDLKAPMRITEVPYIKRKHEEVAAMLKKRPDVRQKVRSMAYCNKCHQEASKGVFDDDTVRIPVYGEWDD
ncbi:MAG: diheme cytochrome c [Mariprofundaceae bacterium]